MGQTTIRSTKGGTRVTTRAPDRDVTLHGFGWGVSADDGDCEEPDGDRPDERVTGFCREQGLRAALSRTRYQPQPTERRLSCAATLTDLRRRSFNRRGVPAAGLNSLERFTTAK
jgi:hypothetical protein